VASLVMNIVLLLSVVVSGAIRLRLWTKGLQGVLACTTGSRRAARWFQIFVLHACLLLLVQ
jgi:diaminopimelate epimerase